MKKLNLNIELKKPIKSNEDGKERELLPMEVSSRWIERMIEVSLNKPDPRTGRPTTSVGLPQQRTYFKLMDKINSSKDGIVELEDELFDFLDRKFHQAELPAQLNVTEIIVKVSDAINRAKVEDK